MPRPRRLLAVAAALAAALAGCAAAPAGRGATALRVATWNLHDLFDEVRQGGPAEPVPAAADVERKLARLGAVLRALDADVVAVEEAENAAILRRLADGPLAGMGYRAFLVDGGDPRGIDVGILSRVPVTRYVVHGAGEGLFAREPAEVHLAVGGRRVVVVAAHLVSKREGPARDARREAQARRLRAIADAAAADGGVVVVAGDLNDEPASAPLAPLLADGAWEDVAARLAPEDGWTYVYRRRRERLDYVLVPRGGAARVARVRVAGAGRPAASDHRPVVVDLVLP